jgi:glycosyltransferase involved in cell wall biosynthesis
MENIHIPSVSVILPLYNGESTIIKTLESLLNQTIKFSELIVVNDASSDKSLELLQDFLKNKLACEIINHKKNFGLAKSYNDAIRISKGELIVTLHQDVILLEESLKKLLVPLKNSEVVASSHAVMHPMKIWSTYNFWQRCFFARKAGKDQHGIDGKFDCFRKSALFRVGLFDELHFRSAGEDADMVFKLKKIGKIADSDAKIVHLHKIDPDFGWKDIVHKQAQYSEAQGALLARGRIRNIGFLGRSFFRELMLLALAVPYLRFFSLALITLYAFLYTKLVFEKNYKDKMILILPFFNISLLLVSLAYSLKGIIYGKQRI